MKVIGYGKSFEIYENDLKTYDALPALTYKVNFSMMSGFSLIQIDDFEMTEDKVYGNHKEKIEKVLKSFEITERSLGIILSGDKGMGKSMFTQLLAKKAISKNIPVIIVTKAYSGVADFIEKIDQEVLVIFDEFEKIFPVDSDSKESQNSLLGLFDGISQKKRIYAITVNHLHKLSEFMLNRTGRFHYHIRFSYPDSREIELYLKDKVQDEYHNEINKVISFASKVKLNYDSLRAIAFELNQGYSFHQAIGDLNILATDSQRYNVIVNFTTGEKTELNRESLDLFSEEVSFNSYLNNGNWVQTKFKTNKIETYLEHMVVDGENVSLEIDSDEKNSERLVVKNIIIKLHEVKGVNYNLVY